MAKLAAVSARERIDEMVRRIVERFDPETVILFGSHARGDAGPDSDVDLLVVVRGVESKRRTRIAIRAALNGVGVAKDVVVATPDEVESRRHRVGTLLKPALAEGKVLYERAR